jgi:hypothetical protein
MCVISTNFLINDGKQEEEEEEEEDNKLQTFVRLKQIFDVDTEV